MSISRLLKSFSYAFRGLFKVWQEEQNMQVHTLVGLIAINFGLWFGLEKYEWLILILVILLVLIMEVVNSAVERVADMLKPRIHGYVKEIKDITAAAVLLSAVGAVVIGLIIFWPHFSQLLGACGYGQNLL